jgi:hypothetical protein
LEPLVRLEDQQILRSFKVDPNEVGGRLDDVEFRMTSSSLTLMSTRPLTDEPCVTLVSSLVSTVEPRALSGLLVMLQYIVPLPNVSYDDARRRGLEALGHGMALSAGANDFAILVTGASPGLMWGVEAGVVARGEVRQRILRQRGYFKGQGPSSELLLARAKEPQVGFFADSQWTVTSFTAPRVDGPAIVEQLSVVEEEAERVMTQIFQGITEFEVNRLEAEG